MKPVGQFEDRTRDLAYRLVSWPSVTGTADEAGFAHRLAELLRQMPYFRDHPDDLRLAPIPGDPLGRSNVMALVRGRGSDTVLLSGHFDVVPVDDYTDLAHLSGSPDELRQALIHRLRSTGGSSQALRDLESGDFVPGRGMLDMKSGLAAGIAVLEHFASLPDRNGNLLLIATPDEEDRSAGMRAAAQMLPDFLRNQNLTAPLAINLDAICDNNDGADGRVVTMGTIGKLLLTAFVVGKDAHACYPLDGVNGAYLAAELVTEMEFAPELGETSGHELASPPTVLGLRDLKPIYNVTTPSRTWVFWNVLMHRRSPADVLGIALSIAQRAADRAAVRLRERAQSVPNAPELAPAWSSIQVLTIAELLARAREVDPEFESAFAQEADTLARRADLDLPTRSRMLVERAWTASKLEGPAIVVGFGSVPYPSVAWQAGTEGERVEALIDEAMAATSDQYGISLKKIRFFPAISDMSFLGPVDAEGMRVAAENTPIWGSSFQWDVAGQATPAIPIINIGPWGRDYHHWLERAHGDYLFRILPDFVWNVAQRVLEVGAVESSNRGDA